MEETRKNKKEEDIVKETWGSMTAGKKIEYLWMYYKGWLAGAVCVALAVCLGVTMYKGRHTNVFLNVIVVGGDNLKAEWLAEEFSQYAGRRRRHDEYDGSYDADGSRGGRRIDLSGKGL